MENELHYDVHAMKTAGAECLQMLREICCKADLMETAFYQREKEPVRIQAPVRSRTEELRGSHAGLSCSL